MAVKRAFKWLAASALLVSVIVTGSAAVAAAPASAAATCYPPGASTCTGSISLSSSVVVLGGELGVTASGFAPRTEARIQFCYFAAFSVPTTLAGDARIATRVPDNAQTGPCNVTASGPNRYDQTLTLSATVFIKAATIIKLSLSPASAKFGNESAVTASVSVQPHTYDFHGQHVAVSSHDITLCTITLDIEGKGSCSPGNKTLEPGSYSFRAQYPGTARLNSSTSAAASLKIMKK